LAGEVLAGVAYSNTDRTTAPIQQSRPACRTRLGSSRRPAGGHGPACPIGAVSPA